MTLSYCIPLFTSKDLSKYQRKFMKHAIDQFYIELYRRILACLSTVLRKNLSDRSSTESLQWLGNFRLGSIIRLIFPNFIADLFFNTTDFFLFFYINVIFCLVAKLPLLNENNSFKVITLFGILLFKEK